MNNGLSIVGSTRKDLNKTREENDFYPSPPHIIKDLLKYENFDNCFIWENACGNGILSEKLKIYTKNSKIYSTDLIDRNYKDFEQYDFLSNTKQLKVDAIITNPPYNCASEWIEKSFIHLKENGRIALLLKLVFLESIERFKLFKLIPLKKVLVYPKRLKIYKNGEIVKNSGLIAYAWFIIEKGYNGNPIIEWIESEYKE